MARPKMPVSGNAAQPQVEVLQAGAHVASDPVNGALASSAAIFRPGRKFNQATDRLSIAKPWQYEAYRQVNICGEARFAVVMFSNIAARADLGVGEPNAKVGNPAWVTEGPEVDAFNELAPTRRDRSKLILDYMIHYSVAGECYLIARDRLDTDPDPTNPAPIWEIVAVTELQRVGETWRVRHDNGHYIDLSSDDAVLRLWNPDPQDRREAWSPFRAMLPTLREIEWLTKHIFTQVRSRLMSAGVWFLPDNLTFPPPPPDAVEGGEEAIAQMNEAEQFMLSLAAASTEMLEGEEVSFPSIVMADADALGSIDKSKLIQFWSDIDDKAMILRTDAIRRFALGMDLPPEQVLGSAGVIGGGQQGARTSGTVNHWGMWANQEQTITTHVEPALNVLATSLTEGFLRVVVEGTDKVVAYDTAALRLRQDRSAEAIELYDRGVLKAEVMVRENGFDPDTDMMNEEEHRIWLLNRIAGGSATPEQVQAALLLLGVPMPGGLAGAGGSTTTAEQVPNGRSGAAPQISDRNLPRALDSHPYEGPPREDHNHDPAPYALATPAIAAASEVLVLRALEKHGNRVLNDGKRGKDKDRMTPPHLAHTLMASGRVPEASEFDFSLASTVFGTLPAMQRARIEARLGQFCHDLCAGREPYTREGLMEALS